MYTCTQAHEHTCVQLMTAETDTSTFVRPQTAVALANALRLRRALGQQHQVVSVFLSYWNGTKGTKTTAARESQFIREVHVGLVLGMKRANHFCLLRFKTDFMECLMMDIYNFGGKA